MHKIIFSTICVALCSYHTSVTAAYYPSDFSYTEAGFNHSQPLEEKLNTTRGEVRFKKTGFYLGASDAIYKERIVNEDRYEMDAYAGIKQSYGDFGYHLGVKSYNRSVEKDIELQEYYIGGNFRNVGVAYATNEDGEYTQLNYKYKLPIATVGFHIGKTTPLLGEEYSDWSVHASRMYKSVRFNAVMTKSEDPLNNDTQFNFGVEHSLSLF